MIYGLLLKTVRISIPLLTAIILCRTKSVGYPVKSNPNKWFENCGISMYEDAGSYPSNGNVNNITQHIVGGTDARHGEFPWMVAIYEDGFFQCGGVLIDNNRILSAAHCVDDIASEYTVILGDSRRDTVAPERVTYNIRFGDIVVHEDYIENQQDADIAIIFLPENLTSVSDHIRPVCAPDPQRAYPGLPGIVSGWGASEWLGTISQVLQYVNLTILSPTRCRSNFGYFPNQIADSNWCAFDPSGGKDACTFDSGSPLIYKRLDGIFELVGLVSWGEGCADPEYPGVYTNVRYFMDWIDENNRQ